MKWKFWQRAPKPQPIPGELYFINNKNPFERVQVRVIDVKGGWLKYCFADFPSMHWTMEIPIFLSIYKKDTS